MTDLYPLKMNVKQRRDIKCVPALAFLLHTNGRPSHKYFFKIPNTTVTTKQLCNLTLVISVTEKWKGCVSLTPKDYGDLVSLD